jgi:hypothetical protein
MSGPYFRPLLGRLDSPEMQQHDAEEASRAAVLEEMARMRALGAPRLAKPELPFVRQPLLADDFAQKVVELDEKIMSRGIAIDRNKLFELGKERFATLLELDRKVPRGAIGSSVDLTSFSSVQRSLHAFEVAAVPRRTTSEQVSGSGKEREPKRKCEIEE